MNMFTKQKNVKKIVITLVLLMLFSFCFPKNIKAGLLDDIVAAPANLLFMAEKGVLKFFNNMFTSAQHKAESTTTYDGQNFNESLKIYLTPENIIKGKFLIFEANIFKEVGPDDEYYDYVGPVNQNNPVDPADPNNTGNDPADSADPNNTGNDKVAEAVTNGREKLRTTIAAWYYALRNLAIVALLSVLVYVGIRMVISTVSQDKAKYKVMFKDWLVALCLLFIVHYIMIAMLNLTSDITKALGERRKYRYDKLNNF